MLSELKFMIVLYLSVAECGQRYEDIPIFCNSAQSVDLSAPISLILALDENITGNSFYTNR